MKNIVKTLVLLFITFPYFCSSQDCLPNEIQFKVNRIQSGITITKEKLKDAQALIDLNENYRPSWVSEYKDVEIITIHNGRKRKTKSNSDRLSQEQKDNMLTADLGSDISVSVRYIPNNSLKHNDIMEMDFTFTVDPDYEAYFHCGEQRLMEYLKESAINKITDDNFKAKDLTAIKFTIDEDGNIIDAHVFESVYQTSENEIVNNLLLDAISNMPRWHPAEYSNGMKVKQDFVITVGNMKSCVINLLNIRKV